MYRLFLSLQQNNLSRIRTNEEQRILLQSSEVKFKYLLKILGMKILRLETECKNRIWRVRNQDNFL